MNLEKFIVFDEYTIKEVIDKFEENNDRVFIVNNKMGKVIGVISQGDVIRALATGKDLYSCIKDIIQTSFLYLYKETDYEKVYEIFKNKLITLLPVIDENFKLLDVITLKDIYKYLESKKENKSHE